MRRISEILRLPNSGVLLLVATFVTTIGNGMHTLAIGKLLYDRTGSVAAFGVVVIFEQIVGFLMQLVAGPWVDRGNPKRTCIQVETARGLAVCFTAYFVSQQEDASVWVLLMTLVIRVAQPFYRASTFALGPAALPPEALGRFNSYSNIGLQSGQLIGVALAGPILSLFGPPMAFLFNGVTFLLSALALVFVSVPHLDVVTPAKQGVSAFKHLFEGWREVYVRLKADAGLAWHLCLTSVDGLAVTAFNLALVPLVAQRFAGNAYWLSFVDAAFAVGAIATAPFVERLEIRFGARALGFAGIFGQALFFLMLAAPNPAYLSPVAAFGIGAMNTVSWTVMTTRLQVRARGPIKGRIGTVRSMVNAVFTAAILPVLAALERLSVSKMALATGFFFLAFACVAFALGRDSALGRRLYGEES